MTVSRRQALGLAITAIAATRTRAGHIGHGTMRGCNLIETAGAPFGSAAAMESLHNLAAIGADTVAIVPFLWQPRPDSPGLVYGDALPPDRLRAGIRQARAAGLRVLIKPHVWVPQNWAGSVEMASDADWQAWFLAYRGALELIADIAREERADALILGTELARTSRRAEWSMLIAAARARYAGPLGYVAHGPEEARRIGFWRQLDAVCVSLYPALGGDDEETAWRGAMARALSASADVARRADRPLWVAEIGIRSARGAAIRPWESAEERAAPIDQHLQAAVLDAWLDEIDRIDAAMVLIWRWLSDPMAGGGQDTDFTIQNKAAEVVIRRRWT